MSTYDDGGLPNTGAKDMTTVKHYVYNKNLHNSAKKLKATWENGEWLFSDDVKKEAEKLKAKWEGPTVLITITAIEDVSQWHGPIYFAGYEIARAFNRDSGAQLGKSVYMLNGTITSGGSRANWTTRIEQGSTFKLRILESMLEKAKTSKYFNVQLSDESDATTDEEDIID